MKAAYFSRHGGPEVIEYGDIKDPTAGPGEALFRVKAAALNRLDIWIRNGIPAYKMTLPHIGGCDASGIVEAVGEGVEGLKPGDEVIVSPGLSCGRCECCLSGRDNLCDAFGIFGAARHGGFAELTVAPAQNLLPKPAGVSFEEAAAFPLTFLTAWHMLIARAGLKAGMTLLVVAAGSGIGAAAVQIGKLAGARVIATAGGEEKLQKARALGADETIDHYREKISERVLAATGGRGADVAFEHVGPATWGESVASLKKGGAVVVCGATTGPDVQQNLRQAFSRELNILGSMLGTRNELRTVSDLVGRGLLKPEVDSIRPLEALAEAQRDMEASRHFGKCVLAPQ